jgi:hypothetical protein
MEIELDCTAGIYFLEILGNETCPALQKIKKGR